ncbi:transposase [Candidatus Enterovibrio escicola]|uniref:transposase n=1 Tax=Candidatus Enterovibrio escicola TaxID=1927127 RepID=UPI0037425902
MSEHNKKLLHGYVRKRHSVSKLVVNVVLTTKYRCKILTGVMIDKLREVFKSACMKRESEVGDVCWDSEPAKPDWAGCHNNTTVSTLLNRGLSGIISSYRQRDQGWHTTCTSRNGK